MALAKRVCFALDLIDDAALIADYERAHAAGCVWPEVTAAIRAELAAVDAKWEAAMDRFQQPLRHAGPGKKWVSMDRIYSLDEQ